jgi:glycosyltransferase involved in cell wall biosynthesis
VTVSLLAPIRDEGPAFRDHLRDCLGSVSGMDVELVLLDNQSLDGCCHGIPPEVLIIRTQRPESPARLLALGRSLAKGECLLWLPGISSLGPDHFRALVAEAWDHAAAEHRFQQKPVSRRLPFTATMAAPALITPHARAQLESWGRIPLLGRMLPAAAASWLPLFVQLSSSGGTNHLVNGAGDPKYRPVSRSARNAAPRLSVIITAHNEGAEVLRTIESVRSNTAVDHEIIVVDDGSTDGSCAGIEALGARVIRHQKRIGVAHSRDAGSSAALGDVFTYLDGHQRVDPGCLDRCAELAAAQDAIVCPPCRPLNRTRPVSYGASLTLCTERGFFSGRYRVDRPQEAVTKVSGLRAPGYTIPRSVYTRVRWVAGLRGWGASDYAIALKAFFADVDILHVNTGATEHLFRKAIPYETSWESVWRNHALIARVCFDDRTWQRYWLPELFQANLSEESLAEMNSPAVLAEHEAFMAIKARPDREFWRGLLHQREPKALN